MKQGKAELTYDSLYITLFFLLLVANTFDRAQLLELHYIGEFSIGITLFMMFFMLIKTWIVQITYDISLLKVYMSLILLTVLFTISFLSTSYIDGYHYIHLLFHLFFILGSIRMYWNQTHLKIASYVFGLVTLILFMYWMQSDFVLFGFKGIYRNENYLAVFLFSLLFFHILAVKFSRNMERVIFSMILGMNILLIVMTSARSVWMSLLVIYIGWKILQSSKAVFEKLIYVVIAGNFLFVATYVGIKDTGFGNMLNGFSMTVFHKNLFSGRPEIWQGVIQAIMDKPFFGHGLGVKAQDVAETNLSAHNMYLQVLLEFGLIGFIIFLFVLISVWLLLMKRLDHFVAKLSASFMLGILVYNNFELTLLQNNYSIAFFQWLIMTVGVNFTVRQKRNDEIDTIS